ncbi:MAG: SIS domain-containing protein [bacterium]|nr:SIS domain-containing protein [bacterium]
MHTRTFRLYLDALSQTLERMQADEELLGRVESARECLGASLASGCKVLIAGNGASATHAEYFASQLVGSFNKSKRRALPALALTTDTSFLTAWSNDVGFESVFARQIEALGRTGDVFIAISTSGNSPNILAGVDEARRQRLKTVSLLGKDGGAMKGRADYEIIVPSSSTQEIQDAHQWILHSWCEALTEMFENK